MKKIILIMLQMASIGVAAQTSPNKEFILTGKIIGRDTGSIVIRYDDALGEYIIDTADLQSGNFEFRGTLKEPTIAAIVGKRKIIDFELVNFANIFLEPGKQHVELTEDNYKAAKVTGSHTQQEFDVYNRIIDSVNSKYKSALDQLNAAKHYYQNANTKAEKDKALQKENITSSRLELRSREILKASVSFVLTHPDSYASPSVFYVQANRLPVDSAISIYNTLTARIKNSVMGKFICNLLRKREQNTIGKSAYDFKAVDINGSIVTLSDFRGKYVLLDFWASWCVPCIKLFPQTKKLFQQYHPKRFEVVAISIDKDTLAWSKSVEQNGIDKWYHILANEDISKNFPNVNNPIPSAILIGPDGRIIWKSGESSTLEEELKRRIK